MLISFDILIIVLTGLSKYIYNIDNQIFIFNNYAELILLSEVKNKEIT